MARHGTTQRSVTVKNQNKDGHWGTYLEVYDDTKDENGGHQVHQVGQVLPVKSFPESTDFVLTGSQQVEESNDSSFEFSTAASVDGSGRKAFPNDGLANVGSDKKRDSRAQSISFLKEFVQKQNNQTGNKQLDDDQKTDTSSDVGGVTVHAGQHVHDALAKSDDHTKH